MRCQDCEHCERSGSVLYCKVYLRRIVDIIVCDYFKEYIESDINEE